MQANNQSENGTFLHGVLMSEFLNLPVTDEPMFYSWQVLQKNQSRLLGNEKSDERQIKRKRVGLYFLYYTIHFCFLKL